MDRIELGEVQEKFAGIVWDTAPVASGALVKICEEKLGWKKPTTYTVLRKLIDKGLFINDGGIVKVKLSREEFYRKRSEQLLESSFSGSLPAFVAAFLSSRKISRKEVDEIEAVIDAYKKEIQ